MSPRTFRIVPFVAGCASVISAAAAQPLIDNLAETTRDATVLGTIDPDRLWAAQSFSSPTNFTLVSIDTLLGLAAAGPDVVAELRRGEDATGPVVATFVVPTLSEGSIEVVTLVPTAAVPLEADALYWLVIGPATTGSFQWAYAEGNNFIGPGAFHNYAYSVDSGITWENYGGDNPYQVRVNVSSACTADFNGDGAVNSQDFFDFLAAFFTSEPAADFNQSGGIDSQDFFDFLTAFFTGCP